MNLDRRRVFNAMVLTTLLLGVLGGIIRVGSTAPAQRRPRGHARHEDPFIVKVIPISAVDITSQQISYGGTLDYTVTLKSNLAAGDWVNIKVWPVESIGSAPLPWTAQVNGNGTDTYLLHKTINSAASFKIKADTLDLNNMPIGQPQTSPHSVMVDIN